MVLKDTAIKKLKAQDKPYKVLDYDGLYLEVRPSGKKYWRVRYSLGNKKEGLFTVGTYPAVSLAEARKKRDWAKEQARQGMNPNDVKRREEAKAGLSQDHTFAALAKEFLATKSWGKQYTAQYKKYMKEEVYPVIGDMPIADIEPEHILTILSGINSRGAVSVTGRVRGHISKVFRYAAGRLLVKSDPTHLLSGIIIQKPAVSYKNMPKAGIPELYRKINGYRGTRVTTLAMLILAHTFVRTVELRRAKWQEIDYDDAMWIIPEEHTKNGRSHLVPLTPQVMGWFKELELLYGPEYSDYIFPGRNGPDTTISGATINQALRRLGYAKEFSGHGFRSTASTILNDNKWDGDAIERQLNHVERGVRGIYNRAKYIEERQKMMRWWSDYLESTLDKPPEPG